MKIVKLEERRSGRTTGNLLNALGEAIANPGKEITYIDHVILEFPNVNRWEIHQHCMKNLSDMIDKLSLKEIHLKLSSEGNLVIKINREPVYVGDDGFCYRRIKN